MNFHTTLVSRCIAGAVIGLAGIAASAQTTTTPDKTMSSPAGRDAQGHAADSTAPIAHSQSAKTGASATTATGAGMMTGKPRTNTTPLNTSPGAGLRNGGDAVPPTSGASGR